MNWQISVQEFFTKNQIITCELDKLTKLNDEELINLSKTEDLILEYIQIKSKNIEILKWKYMTIIFYQKIIKKIFEKANENKKIIFYEKLKEEYFNKENFFYDELLMKNYESFLEKKIEKENFNPNFQNNSHLNNSNKSISNSDEKLKNRQQVIIKNKSNKIKEEKKNNKLNEGYKLLTFNNSDKYEKKSEKKILDLLDKINQSSSIKHFIKESIKNDENIFFTPFYNININHLPLHLKNICLTLIGYFIPFYSFNQKNILLNFLKEIFPISSFKDLTNNIFSYKNTNTVKNILYNLLTEKKDDLNKYEQYFSNYYSEIDLLEKYQLILIFEFMKLNKISNYSNFTLKIGFFIFLTLKNIQYISNLKSKSKEIIFNLYCLKEFYISYNQPMNKYILLNEEKNIFTFNNFNLNKKDIDINKLNVDGLFIKSQLNLFNQTLISVSNFYNLNKEKKLLLITEKQQQKNFGSRILYLKYFKDLLIKQNPKKYLKTLFKLEKNILKYTSENFVLMSYKITELFLPSQIKDIYEDFTGILNYYFYDYNYKLFPYGSVTEFLSSKNSDLDIYLDISDIKFNEKNTFLIKLLNFIENKCEKVKTVISTRICVISFIYRYSKDKRKYLKMDLNISGFVPYLHSCLIRSYSLMDARFPILCLCIKKILKITNLVNKDYEQLYLNSFSWVLLLITFLQDIIEPPILPKLLSDSESKILSYFIQYGNTTKEKRNEKDFKCYLNNIYPEKTKIPINDFDNFKKIYYKNIKKKNKLTVSELLLKFLEFVIFYLKYDTIYLNCSYSNEGFENISNIILNSNKYDFGFKDYFMNKFQAIPNGISRDGIFLIRDPFDYHYNPAHTLRFTSLETFISNLEISYYTLIETGSFDDIEINIKNKNIINK